MSFLYNPSGKTLHITYTIVTCYRSCHQILYYDTDKELKWEWFTLRRLLKGTPIALPSFSRRNGPGLSIERPLSRTTSCLKSHLPTDRGTRNSRDKGVGPYTLHDRGKDRRSDRQCSRFVSFKFRTCKHFRKKFYTARSPTLSQFLLWLWLRNSVHFHGRGEGSGKGFDDSRRH